MLQNKIYKNYLLEITKTFFTIILGLSLIALTVRAVNFLELIVDNGYSLSTYFKFSILNLFGIAPKFFPFAFLLSIAIFIIKHKNNSELVILWTTGVKKIVIVNLLLLSSLIITILYLIFSVYLTPIALNKSRDLLSQSKFNSFLPTIRSKQFSDSFKNLTFFVEEKVNNEIKNIFLYDSGNNLKNLSSNKSDVATTTIIAKKGLVNKKELFLIDGKIISNKKSKKKNEIVQFNQLNINLTSLDTTVIKSPKLQETSTVKLLSCFVKKNMELKICKKESIKETIPVLVRRLVLPIYIPVIALICSFLLFNEGKYLTNRISVFSLSFITLILSELILKYTGTSEVLRIFYIALPLFIIGLIYPFLMYKFSR